MKNRLRILFDTLNKTNVAISRDTAIDVASLSNYLTGKRYPTDRTIKIICLTYGVSETWLRTGNGEMFDQKKDKKTDQRTAALNYVLSIYNQMPYDARAKVIEFCQYLIDYELKKTSDVSKNGESGDFRGASGF